MSLLISLFTLIQAYPYNYQCEQFPLFPPPLPRLWRLFVSRINFKWVTLARTVLLVFVPFYVVQRSLLLPSTTEVQVLTNMFLSVLVCMCVYGDVLGYLRSTVPQVTQIHQNILNLCKDSAHHQVRDESHFFPSANDIFHIFTRPVFRFYLSYLIFTRTLNLDHSWNYVFVAGLFHICRYFKGGCYSANHCADVCGFHHEYTGLRVSPPQPLRHLFIWQWSPIRQTWWRLCWEKVPTLPLWTAMAKQRCTYAVNTTRRNACR